MERFTFIVTCILIVDTIQSGLCFNCYSCTYTRSADPSLDYECVTSPQNVTSGLITIACTAPEMCITKALYDEGMTHIRSVTRSCQPQQEICVGDKCCNLYGVYKTCEYKCRDDLCNDNNPEEHLSSGQTFDDGTGGGGKGGGKTTTACSWITSLIGVMLHFLNKRYF